MYRKSQTASLSLVCEVLGPSFLGRKPSFERRLVGVRGRGNQDPLRSGRGESRGDPATARRRVGQAFQSEPDS